MGSSQNIHLSKEEFLCFLLIYASHIDYEFSKMERKFILSKLDSEVFEKMETLFNSQGDYDSLQLILSHRNNYFHSEDQVDSLISLLKMLFASDGDYSRIEKNFLPFFLKMIDIKANES